VNERIAKLAMQAGIEFTYDPTETPMRAFAECWEDELYQFAQLIARECLSKIENEAAQYNEPVWAIELVNDIKDHFGVEE
jgi:hypothetical protein